MDSCEGAEAEVLAEDGLVVVKFYDPDTHDVVVELNLKPDTARELAFNLTRVSVGIEEGLLP